MYRKGLTEYAKRLIKEPRAFVKRVVRYALKAHNGLMHPLRYAAVSDNKKVIFIKTSDIRYIWQDMHWSRWFPPGTIVLGYKDLESLENYYERVPKDKAVVRHFKEGVPWNDTELFLNHYKKRFESFCYVHGCRDMGELYNYYETKIDPLFFNIKRYGIDYQNYGKGVEPLYIHISSQGEFIWTSNGQHRLAMCMALDIEQVPCRVYSRHKEWQKRREVLKRDLEAGRPVDEALLHHPDMQDIVLAVQGSPADPMPAADNRKAPRTGLPQKPLTQRTTGTSAGSAVRS